MGYSLIAAHPVPLRRIFDTQRRTPSKRNAMLGNDAIAGELTMLSGRARRRSTLLNRETLEVVRYGSCYEDIRDIVRRFFGTELGPRPAE